jgi:hypothetical protein
MAQAVGRQPLTAEARVRARFSPCEICSGQSSTGTGFCPSSLVFPCLYNSTMALHKHISPGGWTIGPLVAAVQRHNLAPSTWRTTNKPVTATDLLNSRTSIHTRPSDIFKLGCNCSHPVNHNVAQKYFTSPYKPQLHTVTLEAWCAIWCTTTTKLPYLRLGLKYTQFSQVIFVLGVLIGAVTDQLLWLRSGQTGTDSKRSKLLLWGHYKSPIQRNFPRLLSWQNS